MLNIEKYRDEISKLGLHFAKKKGKLYHCNDVKCIECDFAREDDDETCRKNILDWLCSEYVEKPTLTEQEWHFCMAVQTGWITRNKDGEILLYFARPVKGEQKWHGYYNCDAVPRMIAFDFVEWEDEEPWTVEELLKLEIRNEE